ncbi:TPA: hypothetical protein U6I48_003869 [Klebsiella aerogenes]|nr:hypothetical protein [Klebsiella aerogenes]
MPKNLDLFNQQTAKIFAILLETFPVPKSIRYTDFGIDIQQLYLDKCSDNPKDVEQENARDVLDGTFRFLNENGYLEFERSDGGYSTVRLSEKSLAILGQQPKSLGGDETMGDRIINAVKNESPSVIAGVITNFFTMGVNLLTS